MNDFQILSKLGEGAYSIVYKAKRWVDGEIYALKKVKIMNWSEKEKENALNEVRILASVKSAFVVSYKEAFFDDKDNTLCIVMEYADKGDLYQKIAEHKKTAMFLEESDIWRILIQLVKGLKALHDLKILHRDWKSANVFLNSDGSAKLGDWNVSKVVKRGLASTQTGTPYYASPEVWKDHPYDNKSDIWSWGCVWYEMITWRPPFRAENMEGLYNKVIKGQIGRLPNRFSADLQTIIKLLIQVAPDSRPSCEQILKNEIIQKRIDYFKAYACDEVSEDQAMWQTIRIPSNMLFWSDKLPRANYETISWGEPKTYRSFPNQREWELKKKENIVLGSPGSNCNCNSNSDGLQMSKIDAVHKQHQNPVLRLLVDKVKVKETECIGIQHNTPKYRVNMQSGKRRIESINCNNGLPKWSNLPPRKRVDININNNGWNMKNRMLQYKGNYRNLEHWNELYKIYAPYVNNQLMGYKNISENKVLNNNHNGNYWSNGENPHDGSNRYVGSTNTKEGPENKMVPKRKWRPIKRTVMNIL